MSSQRAPVITALAAVILTGCGAAGGDQADSASPPTSSPSSSAEATTRAKTPSPVAPSSSPTAPRTTAPSTTARPSHTPKTTAVRSGVPNRLTISALDLREPVRALGLNGGAINPPPHVVQWYTGSVRPGARGISVFAGHVGAYQGRAGIFSSLPRLKVGDEVTVGYAGGGQQTFRIYAKEAVGKKDLQRDQRVWGSTSRRVLALITCDSSAPSVEGHSVRNFVVWASPV